MPLPPPARWRRLDALLDKALVREPDERTAFLRATCGDDPPLYAELVALLERVDEGERAFGERATAFVAPFFEGTGEATAEGLADEALAPGARVGPYRIGPEVGRGGMGSVYLAERADGAFEKQVALKVVRRGTDTDELLRRFARERRLLAGLDHAGIARLLDGGALADGRPYLVMEYVEGEPITAYCDARRLGVEARLALFAEVCEAVAYAHTRLVVHRDLKPTNILVTEDAAGRPHAKLLDFGIARLLADEADAAETQPGRERLTPAYAAPEQITGEAVTTATDTYALGVLLYELLTGRHPLVESAAGREAALRAVLEKEPARPSVAATPEAAASRGPTPDALRRRLRGDLDMIALKALEKNPARRYPSAEALRDDLHRYEARLPVLARPASAAYRAARFVRRHRWAVAAAAAFVVLLATFTVALGVAQQRTARERDAARIERDRAEATAAFLEGLFGAADPLEEERLDTLRAADLLARGAARAEAALARQPLVQAQVQHVIGRTFIALNHLDEAEALLRQAAATRRTHGAPETDVAASELGLGRVLRTRGRAAEALPLTRRALDVWTRHYGRAHEATLDATRELALVLTELGQLDEAEQLTRELVVLYRTRGDSAGVALALLDHAKVLLDQNRLGEARAVAWACVTVVRQALGPRHPRLASPLGVIALTLTAEGRYDEAEPLLREAAATVHGVNPGGLHEAGVLIQLGSVLRHQGRLDEAEATLRTALDARWRRPYDRAQPLGTLASVRRDRGDLAEAEVLQREALALLRAGQPAGAPIVVSSALKLAGILREQREFAEAERLLLDLHEGDEVVRTQEGGADAMRRMLDAELAALYEAWGQPEEAVRYRALASGGPPQSSPHAQYP
jgi:serine/threonine-protein kinase